MFCRIYITGKNVNELSLLDELSKILDVPISDCAYLEDKRYCISIDSNEEYDENKEKEFPDGFLHFKKFIEIDFFDDTSIVFASKITEQILKYLWTNSYSAVASCSYEEYLIENGGYKSVNIPWPK